MKCAVFDQHFRGHLAAMSHYFLVVKFLYIWCAKSAFDFQLCPVKDIPSRSKNKVMSKVCKLTELKN